MGAENHGDCLPLGLAQFRKLFCHMGNRAVVLTDLNSLHGTTDPGCGGGVPGSGQGVGNAFCGNRHVILGLRRRNAGKDRVDAASGE